MTEKTTRVLGVDPGTRVAGYGILDVAPGVAARMVTCGAIYLSRGSIPPRLRELHDKLQGLIREFRPSALAVETVFHGKSFHSVLKVGEARGVVLLAGALNDLEVHQFTPAMVKKASTGNGRAAKRQVQGMICRILELEEVPEPEDVTDALAIAFCYGQRIWRRQLPAGPGRSALRTRGPSSS